MFLNHTPRPGSGDVFSDTAVIDVLSSGGAETKSRFTSPSKDPNFSGLSNTYVTSSTIIPPKYNFGISVDSGIRIPLRWSNFNNQRFRPTQPSRIPSRSGLWNTFTGYYNASGYLQPTSPSDTSVDNIYATVRPQGLRNPLPHECLVTDIHFTDFGSMNIGIRNTMYFAMNKAWGTGQAYMMRLPDYAVIWSGTLNDPETNPFIRVLDYQNEIHIYQSANGKDWTWRGTYNQSQTADINTPWVKDQYCSMVFKTAYPTKMGAIKSVAFRVAEKIPQSYLAWMDHLDWKLYW